MSIGQQDVGAKGVPFAGPFFGWIVKVSTVTGIHSAIPYPIRLGIGDADHVRRHAYRALGNQILLTLNIPTKTQCAIVNRYKLANPPVIVTVGEKCTATGVKVKRKCGVFL